MSWELTRFKEGEKKFVLSGQGMRLYGEVWRGAMKGDAFWGLKALMIPSCRENLIHGPWKIVVPRQVGASKNTGQDRRFVEFVSDKGPGFMLRFSSYVPPEVIAALREAFRGRQRS